CNRSLRYHHRMWRPGIVLGVSAESKCVFVQPRKETYNILRRRGIGIYNKSHDYAALSYADTDRPADLFQWRQIADERVMVRASGTEGSRREHGHVASHQHASRYG